MQVIDKNRGRIVKILVTLVIVAAAAGAGIAVQGEISKRFAAPVIAAFETTSPVITSGQPVTLQWDVTGVNAVSISPDVGTVPAGGRKEVSPGETTTYTLVARNVSGSVSKSVTVTVRGAPPAITSFRVDPASIFTGQSAAMQWNVAGSTAVSIEPEVGAVPPGGTRNVSPGYTTKYVLTASNGAGNSTASASLTVTPSKVPIVTTFSASPAAISAGEPSTLSWDVIGAKSINISQGIGGVASKGSAPVTPAATTVYTILADSDYGSVSRSVTVTVKAADLTGPAISTTPPAVNTFSPSRSSITLGDNVTLNWDVARARTVSISPGVGSVPSSGWTMVIPVETTTYKLSAANTFGTETAETTVTVNRSAEGTAPVIKSFIAVPNTIPQGGTSLISWDIKGATVYIIDQGIGIPSSRYSQQVSPTVTTDYVLTAINSSGTDRAVVTVIVTP